jgi:hypothetical protein
MNYIQLIRTSRLVKNIILGLVLTMLWLGADVYYVKVSRFSATDYDLQLVLAIAFFSFCFVNRNLWKKETVVDKRIYIALLSVFITVLWFVFNFICVMWFHLLIGGSL